MDTKLKKSKGIISFICINLALLVVLCFLANVPSALVYYKEVLQIADSMVQPNFLSTKIVKDYACSIIDSSFVYAENTNSGFRLEDIAADPNMYLEVRVNNKVLVKSPSSSFDNLGMDTKFGDEYGAVYNFINGKLKLRIDGKDIDVYGDNIYNFGSNDMPVPGYANYEANEKQKRVEVLMAFKSTPNTYNLDGQIVYTAMNNLHAEYKAMRLVGIALIVVAILAVLALVVGVLLHKHKKLVDQGFARVIKYIPLELKFFCACVMVWGWIYIVFHLILVELRPFIGTQSLALVLVASVAGSWLLAIDFKYNSPLYKQSVIYVVYQIIAATNVKKGILRKQIRLTILAVACFASALACLFLSFWSAHIGSSPIGFMIFLALTAALLVGCFFSSKEVIDICQNVGKLMEYLEQLSFGNNPSVPQVTNCIEVTSAMEQLAGLEKTLQESLSEKMKAERMKIELIANVSHDIKTPLTSVISYIDLLKEEAGLPVHVNEYITVLDEKSQRLKNMVQDIFEVSKAASGELRVELEKLDLCRLLRQTLADSAEAITDSGMIISESIPAEPYEINADGNRMYRVYQNLIANALKYSLAGSRIHICLQSNGSRVVVSIKNVSAQPVNDTMDFTQRFVRGDESRTDGGSGLGLSIASSFTSACGGKFYVVTDADLFSAYTEFDLL